MSVVAPPEPPRPEELEALIREARMRQLKRRLGAAALVGVLAGAAIAAFSVASGNHARSVVARGRGGAVPESTQRCGIRVSGSRILKGGAPVYRDPAPVAVSSAVRCSGRAIWVVFANGWGMMHEEYVGVRSGDGGRTWHVVFAQQPGVHSPHGIDAEVGPWTLGGPRAAYFVGSCPACLGFGSLSLSVTRDAGQSFRRYRVPGNDRWTPRSIRVRGRLVTIREQRDIWHHQGWRTVTLHVA